MPTDQPTLATLQKAFAASLLAPKDAPPAAGLHTTSAGRFSAYRNNVLVSLVDVIGQAFPKTRILAGGDNFDYAASEYVRDHIPDEARLSVYGADFPDFLGQFMPESAPAFLPDMARLEWARNESFFAPDQKALSAEQVQTALSRVPSTGFEQLHVRLIATARLVLSDFPLYELWRDADRLTKEDIAVLSSSRRAKTDETRSDPDQAHNAGQRLLAKPDLKPGFLVARVPLMDEGTCGDHVWHVPLKTAEAAFVSRLLSGQPLQDAAFGLESLSRDPPFNLQTFLAFLIEESLISSVDTDPDHPSVKTPHHHDKPEGVSP